MNVKLGTSVGNYLHGIHSISGYIGQITTSSPPPVYPGAVCGISTFILWSHRDGKRQGEQHLVCASWSTIPFYVTGPWYPSTQGLSATGPIIITSRCGINPPHTASTYSGPRTCGILIRRLHWGSTGRSRGLYKHGAPHFRYIDELFMPNNWLDVVR